VFLKWYLLFAADGSSVIALKQTMPAEKYSFGSYCPIRGTALP